MPQLGATREDARAAVQLQPGQALGAGRADTAQFLLPAISRCDPPSRGDRLSQSVRASHRESVTDHLGPAVGPPQPPSAGVHRTVREPHRDGVLAGLCAGVESGGIHLVVLEAARTAQRLSQKIRAVELARPPGVVPHATQTPIGHGLLEWASRIRYFSDCERQSLFKDGSGTNTSASEALVYWCRIKLTGQKDCAYKSWDNEVQVALTAQGWEAIILRECEISEQKRLA